jgi:putative endonuclease
VLDWLRRVWGRVLASRDVGARGERVACSYLRKRGLRIIERNARVRRGEIDIVACEGRTLVFVEVKSRTGGAGLEVTGLEKIDGRKRAALRRACDSYRKRSGRRAESYRVDAVTVEFEEDGGGKVKEVRWHPAILDLDAP